MSNISLGDYIKQLREEKGWSQRKLARMAEVSNSTVNRIESDKGGIPDSNTLNLLAVAMKIPSEYLYKLSNGLIDSPYTEVNAEFLYKDNTIEDLAVVMESRTISHYSLNFLSHELQDFVLNPENVRFIELAKKAKDDGVNPDRVTGFIHSLAK